MSQRRGVGATTRTAGEEKKGLGTVKMRDVRGKGKPVENFVSPK